MKTTFQLIVAGLIAVSTLAIGQSRPYSPAGNYGAQRGGGYAPGTIPQQSYNRPSMPSGGQVRYPEYGNRPYQPPYGSVNNPVLRPPSNNWNHGGSRNNWNVNVGINTGWNGVWVNGGWNNGWNNCWNCGWNGGWWDPWNVYNRPIVGWSTSVPYFPAPSPVTFVEQRIVPVPVAVQQPAPVVYEQPAPRYVQPTPEYVQPQPQSNNTRKKIPLDDKWAPVTSTDLVVQQKLNRITDLYNQGTITLEEAREARRDIIYGETE